MLRKNTAIGENLVENYLLLALSSPETDYRLAWLLNNNLQITLQRDSAIPGSSGVAFSVFATGEMSSGTKYLLLANKNKQDGGILLSNYQTVDFFLKISGESDAEKQNEWRTKLKAIPEISACIPLVPVKKADLLFFNNL